MIDPCFIVGGGPSLRGFDYHLLDAKHVIAVNQAIWHLPQAQHFITMDATWLQKSGVLCDTSLSQTWGNAFHHHSAMKTFVLALSEPRLEQLGPARFIDHRYEMVYDLSMFNRVVRASGYGGAMGDSFESFRAGSDSGYSALQLAVILGYKTIYLLGFDFCTSGQMTHGHDDYHPQDVIAYDHRLREYLTPYPQAFDSLRAKGIHVFSGSHISRLNQYILYVDVRYLLASDSL